MRTNEWKFNYFPTSRSGMLFNLKDDPGEFTNLYDDPGYAKVRDEFVGDLLEHLHETKDPLPIRLSQA